MIQVRNSAKTSVRLYFLRCVYIGFEQCEAGEDENVKDGIVGSQLFDQRHEHSRFRRTIHHQFYILLECILYATFPERIWRQRLQHGYISVYIFPDLRKGLGCLEPQEVLIKFNVESEE